jgi:hypothetical protein
MSRAPRPTAAAVRGGVTAALAGNAGMYALLLLLVWGLTAPLRGMWQDDAAQLSIALAHRPFGLAGVFVPTGSPLRRLYELPSFFALATPHPVLALQWMYGAFWLGEALAAGWIAGLLLPQRRLTRLLVTALTLTATSDYLTNNLTSVGYNFAVLTLLLAVGCGLRFVQRGGIGWLLAAAVALGATLWTIDVGIPAVVFLPLLVAWQAGIRPVALLPAWGAVVSPAAFVARPASIRPGPRPLALLLAWGVVVIPVAFVEWRFLHDPQSYAAAALMPLPPSEIARRAAHLWGENFLPWNWVFERPAWYPRPPAVIPAAVMALAAGLAVVALALRVRRTPPEPAAEPASRVLSLVALFALMSLAANAAYASLHFAEIHYRTHVMSRVWASLALGILAGWAAARWPRRRFAVLALPALFVGLGTWGGLERQDLFLATWRQHHRELLSIAAAAPALRPGTGIILRGSPVRPTYLATQADYLTQAWVALIYQQPQHCLRLTAVRGTGCKASSGGLDCWHEGRADCFAAGTCAPDHFDYDRLVVMDYDEQGGVYRLRTSLAGDPLAAGAGAAAAAYRPAACILSRPLSTAQRRLLLD